MSEGRPAPADNLNPIDNFTVNSHKVSTALHALAILRHSLDRVAGGGGCQLHSGGIHTHSAGTGRDHLGPAVDARPANRSMTEARQSARFSVKQKGAPCRRLFSTNFNQEVFGLIGLKLETRRNHRSCTVFGNYCRPTVALSGPQ